MYHYLLTYDIGDFTTSARPPSTEAKADLSKACESSPVRFFRLWENDQLPVRFQSCTADHLFQAYSSWCFGSKEFQVSATRFGLEIKSLLARYPNPRIVRRTDVRPRRFDVDGSFITTMFAQELGEFRKKVADEKP